MQIDNSKMPIAEEKMDVAEGELIAYHEFDPVLSKKMNLVNGVSMPICYLRLY